MGSVHHALMVYGSSCYLHISWFGRDARTGRGRGWLSLLYVVLGGEVEEHEAVGPRSR